MIDKKWIGHEFPPSELALERGRLRFFALAIGETDPVYTDVDAARAAGYATTADAPARRRRATPRPPPRHRCSRQAA